MLVLTRKTSQVIQLGHDITITVVRTSNGSVKLGIQAPPDIRILRKELMPIPGNHCVEAPSGSQPVQGHASPAGRGEFLWCALTSPLVP